MQTQLPVETPKANSEAATTDLSNTNLQSVQPQLPQEEQGKRRMKISKTRALAGFLLCVAFVTFLACGGGGGGSGFDGSSDPGDLALSVEKSKMDSGDITRVRLEIFDIKPEGVMLKVRYSGAMRYVTNSATLFYGEDEERAAFPHTDAAYQDARYLVFFLSRRSANGGSYISLDLELKATSGDPDAFVEVDLDNNDPSIPDSEEFTIYRPRFTAQEHWGINITGNARPTPKPLGTATPPAS